MSKSYAAEILSANQAIYKYSIETPNAIALQDKHNVLTYSELAIYIQKFSKLLGQFGIENGTTVHLSCSNYSMCLIIILALENIGAVRTPLTSNCDASLSDNPKSLDSKNYLNININQELINNARRLEVNDKDYQCLNKKISNKTKLYISSTSGTTGEKKFFYKTSRGAKEWVSFFSSFYFKDQSLINNLSLYNPSIGFSYVASLLSFNRGGRTVFLDSTTIFQNKTMNASGFCTMTLSDIDYCYRNHYQLNIKINVIRAIGAELALHHRKYLYANMTHTLINSYSANEFGQVGHVDDDGYCYIYPNINVKIMDENFNTLPLGESGRIAIKSSQIIDKYIDSKLNSNHFKDDFFVSNDYGFLKDASTLKVLGRIDNILNIGGIKYPSEPLEQDIERNSNIRSCVLLADNIMFGVGIIFICIEQLKNVSVSSLSEEINGKVNSYFSGLNIKTKILEFKEFERTETGKIIRSVIKSTIINKQFI